MSNNDDMTTDERRPRIASAADAEELARLLHEFNAEFDTPTPGVAPLAARLRALLCTDHTFAILAGAPAVAFGLVTLRSNVWHDGLVALLDELYVAPAFRNQQIGSAIIATLLQESVTRGIELIEINVDESDVDAQRFYQRHGFGVIEPDTGERALYYSLDLPG